MKQGKKLTVAERNHVITCGLRPQTWLISKKQAREWTLISRNTGKPRVIAAPGN